MNRLLLAVTLVLCTLAHADCPRPAGALAQGRASATDEQRLTFLSGLATSESNHIGVWKMLSGSAFAVLVVGQLAIAPFFDEKVRPDYAWGAAYSALGVASTLIATPQVFEQGPAFAARAAAATVEARCAVIAEGELLLAQSAADEVRTRQWFIHALNIAVNFSLGAILGFGYHHWQNATINTLAGIAISETVLSMKPHALISGWREYLGGQAPMTFQFRVSPLFSGGATVGVGGTF
jgi:hypothetical protein